MSSIFELQSFYKRIFNDAVGPVVSDAGHFNIFKVDDLYLQQYKKGSYSRRNFYKISLVTGHSKIHYADQTIEVPESMIVFTNPMVPYSWERIGEHHTGYFCIFTEGFFSRFGNMKDYPVFQSADNAVIPLTADETTHYTELFQRMYNELHGSYAYKYDLLRSLLMEVIHTAQKMKPVTGITPSGSNASDRISGVFAELLERQFPIELSNQTMLLRSPSDFAAQLNVHVNHLNKALKEITGYTTTQLINERMLQEASLLLKNTEWAIAEIGWCLGFEESNHFSSFFKAKNGITPKAYRKSNVD